jgi:hypothetical protein
MTPSLGFLLDLGMADVPLRVGPAYADHSLEFNPCPRRQPGVCFWERRLKARVSVQR